MDRLLLEEKMPHHQTWELAREEWAFLPSEEDDEEDADGAEDHDPMTGR